MNLMLSDNCSIFVVYMSVFNFAKIGCNSVNTIAYSCFVKIGLVLIKSV